MANWYRHKLLILLVAAIPIVAFLGLEIYDQVDEEPGFYGPKPDEGQAHHTIPGFSFVNQDGEKVSNKVFEEKVYVANFFFTSCPTTCPPMMKQLKRVEKRFDTSDHFRIISFTVDPKHDTVKTLKRYTEREEIDTDRWDLVTGDKMDIYALARNGFDVVSLEGDGGHAGFIHSSKLVLIDRQNRIRGYYEGTEKSEVDQLMESIEYLLKKESSEKTTLKFSL